MAYVSKGSRRSSMTLRELKALRQEQHRQLNVLKPVNREVDEKSRSFTDRSLVSNEQEILSELKFNISRRPSSSPFKTDKENSVVQLQDKNNNVPNRISSRTASTSSCYTCSDQPTTSTSSSTSPRKAQIEKSRSWFFHWLTVPNGWDREMAAGVLEYMMTAETKLTPEGKTASPNIRPHMRAVLCDWLVQVQHHLRLLPSTLYLAVQYTDRFIRMEKIELGYYQLLGVTSIFLASKLEERYQPEVSELVYLTDNTYTVSDVIAMERKILDVLSFRLCTPEASFFLRLGVDACPELDDEEKDVFLMRSLYLLDLYMVDENWSQTAPSFAAAAALALVLEIENMKYPRNLECLFGYRGLELRSLMSVMARYLLLGDQGKFLGCYQKYCSVSQYQALAKDVWTKCAVVRQLAARKDPLFLSAKNLGDY